MKKTIVSILVICCLLATSTVSINAFGSEEKNTPVVNTPETVNTVASNPNSFNGYILYTEMLGKTTYLINDTKQVVHKWNSDYLGMDVHLLENGNLLSTCLKFNPTFWFKTPGGYTGRIEICDWNGTLLWEF